ncbi:MAG: hypothetical protein ACJAVM_001254 [Sulfitobacter sp.]|jgi:hypothetical protein
MLWFELQDPQEGLRLTKVLALNLIKYRRVGAEFGAKRIRC